MGAIQDSSVGTVPEVSYGTALTASRFYEFVDESFGFEKSIKQGQGIRVSSKVARSPRRVVATTSASGAITIEMVSKGLGTLLHAAFGASAVTSVTTGTYQMNFTLGSTATPPSLTLQKSVVRSDGTIDPYTFSGVVVQNFKIDCPNGDIVALKASTVAKDVTTATTYSTPSYVSSPSLFHFAQGAITIGGTVVAPTTTALASGGTSVANVRDFNIKVDNKLATDRYNIGGAGKMVSPTYGLREVTGSMTVEYADQTLVNAFLSDTELALSLTFTSTESLSTGYAQLQIVLPAIKLNGELPKANGTDLVTATVDFDVLDNLTATQPIWLVLRTSDAAL